MLHHTMQLRFLLFIVFCLFVLFLFITVKIIEASIYEEGDFA